MKFAFFILAFFLLLQTYHARHLHDVFVNRRFYRAAPLHAAEIIQMVTRGEELLSPPLLQDKTTYGRVNSPPPAPQGATPRGQTTYGRVNPKAPPSPSVAPSRGQTTFGVENPSFTAQTTQTSSNPSNLDLHGIYGRDKPSAPTPPKPADPIRPMLSEYACNDSRSESTNLSTSVVNLLASYAFRVVNLWG